MGSQAKGPWFLNIFGSWVFTYKLLDSKSGAVWTYYETGSVSYSVSYSGCRMRVACLQGGYSCVWLDWSDFIPSAMMITPCGSWLCIPKILSKTHMFDILSPSNLWGRNVDPFTFADWDATCQEPQLLDKLGSKRWIPQVSMVLPTRAGCQVSQFPFFRYHRGFPKPWWVTRGSRYAHHGELPGFQRLQYAEQPPWGLWLLEQHSFGEQGVVEMGQIQQKWGMIDLPHKLSQGNPDGPGRCDTVGHCRARNLGCQCSFCAQGWHVETEFDQAV